MSSVWLNKQILRKVYRAPKWKVVGGDESCQWVPHITAGCRQSWNWLRARGVWYKSSCFQPLLEARLNHLAPKSLERDTATGSILGVSLILTLDTNDLFAEIGSLAGPNLEWHFASRTCLCKHERTMATTKEGRVSSRGLVLWLKAWEGGAWQIIQGKAHSGKAI